MLAIFQPGTSLTWDLLWQSSLFLAIGLGQAPSSAAIPPGRIASSS